MSAAHALAAAWDLARPERRMALPDGRMLDLDRAGPGTIAEVVALNALAVASLGAPGLMMPQPAPFFQRILSEGRGLILTLRAPGPGAPLVAYSVLAEAGEALPAFLPPAAGPAAAVGLLFGTGIDPAWQGQGLQRHFIGLRLALARAAGFAAAQVTVAPGNRRSLANLLDAGFTGFALQRLLDGFPRLILSHPLQPRPPAEAAAATEAVPSTDLDRQRRLLEAGHRLIGRQGPIGPEMQLLFRE